jgi:hypothetical protein
MQFAAETIVFHVGMLNDKTRTSSYLATIRKVVRPSDVVVDIGTGTGILAIAAAQAGARHVYAIEVGRVAKIARALIRANGLAHRITVIRGWSTEVKLPERADVLVSELIGNDPLAEGVLGLTKDALRRLLKPGARLVPSRLKIFGLPVTIPEDELGKRTFSTETLQNWQRWYGIEPDPLTEVSPFFHFFGLINPYAMRDWKTLSDPVLLVDMDFRTWRGRWIHQTVTGTAQTAGPLNGLIVYFELLVGQTSFLTTHPALVNQDNVWLTPVYGVPYSMSLQPGEQFDVTYRYWFWRGLSSCQVNRRRTG